MTIEECYKQLGGDYSNVLSRLSNDAIIRKFLVKFLSDGSCGNIFTNLESGNMEEAFRAAHTLKGICRIWEWTTFTAPLLKLRKLCVAAATTPMKRCSAA